MNVNDKLARIRKQAEEGAILRRTVADQIGPRLIELAAQISAVIGSGGKLLLAGNGGSAGDASHFAAEMIVRLTAERNRQSLPALALNADSLILTAAANDYGFENIFARQLEGLGRRGDMLIAISTSGNSENLVRAVHTAREMGVLTVGLLGGTGGKLAGLVDWPIVVPHTSTARIQEEHIFLIHTIVELVEADLL